ncbi:proteinase inhibitor, propeptide [Wolffia australiana]
MRSNLFFVCCLFSLVSASVAVISMDDAAVHIVYTESPKDGDPEAYHVKTLTSVLGSEEAAREALVYSYKSAVSGFSAKLTSQQVAEITKQPGVIHVAPSLAHHLHG